METAYIAPDPLPPATMMDVDQTGNNLPGNPTGTIPNRRQFRRAQTEAPAGVAAPADMPASVAVHSTVGAPDPRRGFDPTDPYQQSWPESHVMSRTPVGNIEQQPPARFRGGFTGADPARPAEVFRNMFLRAFDQQAAHNFTDRKVSLAQPLAAVSLYQPDPIPGALPSNVPINPSAFEGAGMQPNSLRVVPRPWDELVVNTGGSTPAPLKRGWRA